MTKKKSSTSTTTTTCTNTKKSSSGNNNQQQQQQQNNSNAVVVVRRRTESIRDNVQISPWMNDNELHIVGQSLLSIVPLINNYNNNNSNSNCDSNQQHYQNETCKNNNYNHSDTNIPKNKKIKFDTTSTETKQQQQQAQEQKINPKEQLLSIPDALERIALWKLRIGVGLLPHSIESTSILVQALWRDYCCTSSSKSNLTTTTTNNETNTIITSSELQYIYSCAIIRMVNGYADTLQQNRLYVTSVTILCEQIGIPEWIVSIRHNATHQSIPSLNILRLAATSCIQYINTVYWTPTIEKYYYENHLLLNTLQHYITITNRSNTTILSSSISDDDNNTDKNDLSTNAVKNNANTTKSDNVVKVGNDDDMDEGTTTSTVNIVETASSAAAAATKTTITTANNDNNNNTNRFSILRELMISTKTLKKREKEQIRIEQAIKRQQAQERRQLLIEKEQKRITKLQQQRLLLKQRKKNNYLITIPKTTTDILKNLIKSNYTISLLYNTITSFFIGTNYNNNHDHKNIDYCTIIDNNNIDNNYNSTTTVDVDYNGVFLYSVYSKLSSKSIGRNSNSDNYNTNEQEDCSKTAITTTSATSSLSSSTTMMLMDIQQIDFLFEECRKRFVPLLVTMIQSYPGYLHHIIIHSVDLFLHMCTIQNYTNNNDCTIPQKHYNDNNNNNNNIIISSSSYYYHHCDKYFLFKLIQYLISSSFLSRFDQYNYSINHSKVPKSCKKKTKMLPTKKSCLESADATILVHNFQIPINSLCDRCQDLINNITIQKQSSQKTNNNYKNSTVNNNDTMDIDPLIPKDIVRTSNDLLHLLEQSLGQLRNCQLYTTTDQILMPLSSSSTTTASSDTDRRSYHHLFMQQHMPHQNLATTSDNSDIQQPLSSLDDIELFLAAELTVLVAATDNVDSVMDNTSPVIATTAKTIHSIPNSNNNNDNNSDNITTETKKKSIWSKCQSWEPCPIGTLPGYPTTAIGLQL